MRDIGKNNHLRIAATVVFILVLSSNCFSATADEYLRGNLNMFKETFFSHPVGPFMWDASDTGLIINGEAEVGTNRIVNYVGREHIQEYAAGIDGKSLQLSTEPNDPDGAVIYAGLIAEPLVPDGAWTYLISWTEVCSAATPGSCDGLVMYFLGKDAGGNSQPIFSHNYSNNQFFFNGLYRGIAQKDEPNRFLAEVNLLTQTFSLAIYDGNNYETLMTNEPISSEVPVESLYVVQFSLNPSTTHYLEYAVTDIRVVSSATDADGDRIADVTTCGTRGCPALDNCRDDFNPDQADQDRDGIGDVCDVCPLSANALPAGTDCPPPTEALQPTGDSSVDVNNNNVTVCANWPVPDPSSWPESYPYYVIPPDCNNLQFELLDPNGQPLQPNCLTMPAYDIDADTSLLTDPPDPTNPGEYCVTCNLAERFPLVAEYTLAPMSISSIFYESYITDPWIDPATGECLDNIAGLSRGSEPCKDVWIGRFEIQRSANEGVNNTPIPLNDTLPAQEDIPLSISKATLLDNDTDVDGDELIITGFTQPQHGALTETAENLLYEPVLNYYGTDTFTYTVSDSKVESTATVTINVASIDDGAPVASADGYTTAEDTSITFDVRDNDTDVDGDSLVATKTSDTVHGVISQNPDGSFTYEPGANYSGSDSFTYTVNDGTTDSNEANVNISVTQVNDPPVAFGDSYSTLEDTPFTFDVRGNDSDIENDPLEANVLSGPANGNLSKNTDGSFTYAPESNVFGQDSFTYTVNDGEYDSNLATVIIDVTPVNDAPVAIDDSYETYEDIPLTFDVRGNDSDIENDPLEANVVSGPANGSLSKNADGNFTYSPNYNYFGPDEFTYVANDGDADSNVATVEIMVFSDYWDGFFNPIDMTAVNQVKAGRSISVKFSLGGDHGLVIFEAGFPKSFGISTGLNDEVHLVDEDPTETAGKSGLSYDPATDQYVYIWKTSKGWAKSSRRLIIKLKDGTEHIADFKFTK